MEKVHEKCTGRISSRGKRERNSRGPATNQRCVNSQFAWSETRHDVRDDLFSKRTATGGIAQLVERQLCKLDVRGSSPRASTSFGKKAGAGNFSN